MICTTDLLLALDSRFYQFTAYRPAGYWAPAKDVTKVQATGKLDKGTDNKSASRAVKAKEELTAVEKK